MEESGIRRMTLFIRIMPFPGLYSQAYIHALISSLNHTQTVRLHKDLILHAA